MSNLKTSLKVGLQMLSLLASSGHRPLAVRELSAELNQSEKYLEQLLLPLRRARIVVSTRGPHGGYQLARAPEQISLLEILELMQGPLTFCDCTNRQCGECVNPALWQTLEACIDKSIASVSLADVIAGRPMSVPDHVVLSPVWVRDGLGI
ncbi:MAG: Rrf2 family transcriptional regulator [Sulfobacillus acidophilus]|uniref:Rrf2 family transcriptional regulator n=1 Tax=Sulfobacillus acidophilus TaxID=53633 RepID=A0A2T2WEA2_9FIRM|nr:MAG: Rrf2 family transcriptional regulator [Sulfobacillus acidophilus]